MIWAVAAYFAFTLGYWALESDIKTDITECIGDQVELYGDLCAESSSGYEDMSGSDAHFEGVKCATDVARGCVAR